jgi:putative transposase
MGYVRAKFFVCVHVVWSTRGRVAVMARDVDDLLSASVRSAASDVGCSAIAVGNAADHVHALLRVAPNVALSTLVQRIKGRTSRGLGLRWQVGYFAESIGVADLTTVAAYVERQRVHHDGSHPLELWSQTPSS